MLERDAELAAIQRAFEQARAGAGCLVTIEGEAGIGKTSLLRAAAGAARSAGVLVFHAAGSELESSQGFGVVRSLLTEVHRMPLPRDPFEGPAAGARAVLEPGSTGAPGIIADRADTFHALFWLMVNLTEHAPVVVAVDDAHWADAASAEFLAYLVPRLRDLPLVLTVAMRPTAQSPALDALRSSEMATRLVLSPLSSDAVSILASDAGLGTLDRAQRDAIWSEAGGNPFYLVELLRARSGGVVSGGDTSVPDTVRRAIEHRIGAEGTDTRRVAEAIAVLGEPPTVEVVAAVAELDDRTAVTAVRRMTADGILERARLAFSHPIVRSSMLTPFQR